MNTCLSGARLLTVAPASGTLNGRFRGPILREWSFSEDECTGCSKSSERRPGDHMENETWDALKAHLNYNGFNATRWSAVSKLQDWLNCFNGPCRIPR